MAFTGDFLCSTFLLELLEAKHNFLLSGGDTFNMALYDNSAAFDETTSAYTATNELPDATGNYNRPGKALTRIDPARTLKTSFCDFADLVWSTATFSAYGAMIYNDTAAGDPSVVILDFGGIKTATAGDFTVQFPVADATTGIIRISGP